MERGSLTVHLAGSGRVIARLTAVVTVLLVFAARLIGQDSGKDSSVKSPTTASLGKYDSGDPGAAGFGREVDAALLVLLELKAAQQAAVLAKVKAAVEKTDTPLLRSIRELAAIARS